MDTSLTHEQFLQRLESRKGLFAVAVSQDVKKMFYPGSPITELQIASEKIENPVSIDLAKQIADLLVKEVFRIVDLVYDDKLD